MSEVTAVPLQPIKKGSLAKLWIGTAIVVAIGAGAAWQMTAKQVAKARPAFEFLADNAKKSGVITTPSGLQYQVVKEGNGQKPTTDDVVLVEYDGKLADGTSFDSSAKNGGPATLPVGGLIPGWVEGLQLMSKGSSFKFWIPPELAYGEAGAGNGVIPANAALVFDVTLLDIAPKGAMHGGPAGMPEGAHGEGMAEGAMPH